VETNENAVPRPTRRDPYAALQLRDFRLLIIGRFVAQLGEMMVSVAVGWELYLRTGDPFSLGLIGLVQIIPVLLLSLPGGYVADRYNRRMILFWTQLLLVACSGVLAYVSITAGSLVLLYLTLAVIGVGRAFNNPAESALTPMYVPPELFYSAVMWNSSVWQVSSIVGPAIGGLIIGITQSAAPVYIINMVAGLVLVGVLLILRSERKVEPMSLEESPLQSVKNGWSFVRRTEVILGSITLDMFAVLLGGVTFLLPVFAEDILHVGATGLGIMRAAPSVGAMLMLITIAYLPPFRQAGRTLLLAVAGFGVATIVFGVSQSFWLSLAMLALLGALDYISVVIRHTLVLTLTPDEMRGRVSAVNSMFIGASNELGGFESGVAAGLLGPVGSAIFGGIGTIVVVALVAWKAPLLRNYGEITRTKEET
jgi:MFS family permease